MKLFIYCRGHEATIDQQERSTVDFAKSNNIIVPRIFREGPLPPGTFYWKAPKLAAALSFASGHNHAAEGILVETLEALGSDMLTISLALYAAEWMGVEIFSVANGLKPLRAADDNYRKSIVAAMEAGISWDRYLKSQHLAEARKQSRKKKEFTDDLSEDAGYARRGDLAQRTFERGVVGYIFFQRFEKKLSFPKIAKLLAAHHIPIPNPNFSASRPWQAYRGPYAWSVDTVRNVLSHWKARTDLLREFYVADLPTI